MTWGLKRFSCFSPIGLSVAGAAVHHIGQLCCAALITGSSSVLAYLPIMLLCSLVTGTLTGSLCIVVYRRINNHS
jgi:heptaprenyl diphosphate synthase